MQTEIALLKKARELINRGWLRASLESNESYCALGAINKASGVSNYTVSDGFPYERARESYLEVAGCLSEVRFHAMRELFKTAVQNNWASPSLIYEMTCTEMPLTIFLYRINDSLDQASVLEWFDSTAERLSLEITATLPGPQKEIYVEPLKETTPTPEPAPHTEPTPTPEPEPAHEPAPQEPIPA